MPSRCYSLVHEHSATIVTKFYSRRWKQFVLLGAPIASTNSGPVDSMYGLCNIFPIEFAPYIIVLRTDRGARGRSLEPRRNSREWRSLCKAIYCNDSLPGDSRMDQRLFLREIRLGIFVTMRENCGFIGDDRMGRGNANGRFERMEQCGLED